MEKENEAFVLQLLQKIKPHTIIIFVSHKAEVVHHISNAVYHLDKGKLNPLQTASH